ncbi:MAG: T9SS type A sorting domain-containing protein, partial [Chitinophagaceae bacterium]
FKTVGGHTLIQIIDTLGRVIRTLVEKHYAAAATDFVTFNGEGLPTGIYYARLQNGVTQKVRPMMKVRE